MLSTNPKVMNLIALGVAKLNYASLTAIRKYLGNDVELGLIGFAIVLRTRRDWFDYVEHHGLTEETLQKIGAHKGYTTSVSEIAAFTELSRSTVSRKMARLEDAGVIERVGHDRWHLLDFQHGEPSPPALMLKEMLHSYVTITHALERLVPEEVEAARFAARQQGSAVKPHALLEEEAELKESRGLAIR